MGEATRALGWQVFWVPDRLGGTAVPAVSLFDRGHRFERNNYPEAFSFGRPADPPELPKFLAADFNPLTP